MSASDLFDQCASNLNEQSSVQDLAACISSTLKSAPSEESTNANTRQSILLVYAASLVFIMQAGFAMVCAGAVRTKNVQNSMIKNVLDTCGAAVSFFAVGYAFAFGGSDPESPEKTFIGTANFFLMDVENLAKWLFQYTFAAASATIVAGALAERCQMASYLCYSILVSGWIYPIIAHAVWNPQGFLSAFALEPLWGVGMIDFSGSGVVHVTGGLTALIAAKFLGARQGRFVDEDGEDLKIPKEFHGHSIALQVLGTMILWFGWFGFNAGSALTLSSPISEYEKQDIAALAAVNTCLAASIAGIVSLALNFYLVDRFTGEGVFDVKFCLNGALAGLVAITAGCGVLEPWASIVVGFIAGFLYVGSSNYLLKLKIDDVVDASPVHLTNGIWGVLSVAFFASPQRLIAAYGHADHPGLFYAFREGRFDATLLATQLVGILFILSWTAFFIVILFVWLDWKGWLRADSLEEIVGLDTSYHSGAVLHDLVSDEQVDPALYDAFRKQRDDMASRRRNSRENLSQQEETKMSSETGHSVPTEAG